MNWSSRLMWSSLLFTFLVYPAVAWLALRCTRGKLRDWLFALVNLAGAFAISAAALVDNRRPGPAIVRVVGVAFLAYIVFVLVNYLLLRRARNEETIWVNLALWLPIAALILVKYIPGVGYPFARPLHSISVAHLSALFLGLSYLTFRMCHLVQEVRNRVVEVPTLAEYLAFSFFVPTLSLGPINPYSKYIASYRNPSRDPGRIDRSLLRILVGLAKYLFLSTLLSHYTYSGLILDGHPHLKIDLLIALFSYTLYLYCNFSGFCDMVIGVSGLIGIDVMENFNVPFSARNLQEFWNKWHISLSTWLRDMMFTPLVKMLVRIFGPKSANNAIAASVCIVFIVIGIWHGVGINFALFGLFHGIGLATVHYYQIFLKKRLGKERFLRYRQNRLIAAVGTVMTFVYFSLSLFLFANSWENMHEIFKVLV